jgi:hypothetical protein
MTDDRFQLRRLEEPTIQFDGGSAVAPKRGLVQYGPRLNSNQHQTLNIGAIGDRISIRRLNDLFLDMETPIHPDLDGEGIRPWRVPYPGMGSDSNLDISIAFRERWRTRLQDADLVGLEAESDPRTKMEYFLELLGDDLDWLASDDPAPDVIILCIPEKVMDECTPDGQDHANVSADGSDLRNRVKILGMENSIPTQLIKPSTLDISSERQKASRGWNLTVGLLYKAQRGHPWKTKELEEGACYAGISFYQERGTEGDVVRAALAHVFARKDYTILQSEPMADLEEDENGRPHLSAEGAQQVTEKIVEYYKRRNRGRLPERLLLQKTSPFWPDERTGFAEGAADVPVNDFVHIRTRNTGVRLFPDGEFPPLRGTLLSIPHDDIHYLYTTGYTPEMATYEGSNIPEPIEIRPDQQCESDREKLCREILFLTKLDWNTSDFAVKEPVTLKVSRKVSRVLSETEADPSTADTQYFYYM